MIAKERAAIRHQPDLLFLMQRVKYSWRGHAGAGCCESVDRFD